MRRRSLYTLLAANSISLLGSQFTVVALPWFVLQATGSAAKTGLTGFSVALPYFLVGVFGGAFVDRFGYRNMSVLADIVSGCAIASVPLLYHTVGLSFWQLMVLVFFSSFLSIPGLSARRSMLPAMAASAGVRLERVNAAFEGVYPVSALLGPPVAGLLIVWLGASNVLWVDAATFAISATFVLLGVPESTPAASPVMRGRYIDDLLKGIDFLRRDRLLLLMAVSLTASNFLVGPLFGVILPVFARDAFHSAKDLGFMLSSFGVGQVGGSLVYGVAGGRLPRRATWLVGFAGVAVPFWALVWHPGLPVMLVVLALAALTDGPLTPMSVTIRHERTPPELRGRVFSTFSAISTMAVPLGMAATGFVVGAVGLTRAVLILALLSSLMAVILLVAPVFRQMDVRLAKDDRGSPRPATDSGEG